MRSPRPTPLRLLLASSGWIALAAVALPSGTPLRAAVTATFVLVCPGGAAIVPAGPAARSGRLAACVAALALSVAIAALVAQALFLTHRFTTDRALLVLACLTTVLALFPRRFRRSSDRSAPGRPAPNRGTDTDTAATTSTTARHRRPAERRIGYLAGAGLLVCAAACSTATGSPLPRPTGTGTAGTGTAATRQPVAPGQWHPVFSDDFSGPTLNGADWTTCYDWNKGGCTNAGNHEQEWYRPSQVSQADGALTLTADRRTTQGSDGNGYPWASGMVSTGRDSWNGTPRHAFTYGYYAAAIQAPRDAAGFFPAFWLIPAASHGTPPELDVAEFINSNQHVDMNLHWRTADGNDVHVGQTSSPADFAAGYHVFAMDWEPDAVTWYIDGVQRFQVTRTSDIPKVAMELVINLAVGFQESPPPSVDSARLHVDWVEVWQH